MKPVKKVEIYFSTIGLVVWTANGPIGKPQDHTPLVPITYGVHSGVPFSMHAGKGKCCMWSIKKVKIYFSKIGPLHLKSYTPWSHSPLGLTLGSGVPFYLHAGKGNAACWSVKKWILIIQK